jgi:hypothetical protein
LPNVDEAITATILANNAAIWRATWPAAAQAGLAEFVVAQIDPDAATIAPDWLQLDDAQRRGNIAAASVTAVDRVVELLMARRDAFNAAVVAVGHLPQSNGQLRRRLPRIASTLASNQLSHDLLQPNPFPALWLEVANALARGTASDIEAARAAPLPDWRLLNRLLLCGYFVSCRHLFAGDVRNDLAQKFASLVPIRGPLVRLAGQVAATGVAEATPRIVAGRGTVTLRRPGLSVLLDATQNESRLIARGEGLFHRLIGIDHPIDPPPEMRGRVNEAGFRAGRDAIFRQYEHTVAAYMLLASIEHLLRTWASCCGVQHLAAVGRPISALNWVHLLNPSPGLRDQINELYSAERSNVRNRFLHGGLFDVESSRALIILSHYFPAHYPATAVGQSPYAIENIANMCANCLEAVEQEAIAAGITAGDMMWADRVFLTPAEIELGQIVSADFHGSRGDEISDQIGNLIGAFSSEIGQFVRTGLIGWYGLNPPDPLVRFMVMVLIFEALYRIVAHLHGFDVLQRDDVNKRYQYLMLDEHGLCAPHVIARLLEILPERDRPTAERILFLAVKARNALAHGAVRTFTVDMLDGAGHLVAKSMHLLVAGTLHHMIREAAYYYYLSGRGGNAGDMASDWRWAQAQILDRIER